MQCPGNFGFPVRTQRDDRPSAPGAGKLGTARAVRTSDFNHFFQLRRRYLQCVQVTMTYIHQGTQRVVVAALQCMGTGETDFIDLIEDGVVKLPIFFVS